LRIDRAVDAQSAIGESIENLKVLVPARANVPFGASAREQKFLAVCKYFNSGTYTREKIFVCEVPEAYCHIGTGTVCTKDFSVISDSQMEYRLPWARIHRWFKPFWVRRLRGEYATINNVEWRVWWHWLVDCLPRLYSLYKAYPGRKVVLLMPREMGQTFRDSLESALPPKFEVRYLPSQTWVKVDRMLLPSYVSARCNGHLPEDYYGFIRQTVFAKYGLPPVNRPVERIYVSRAFTAHRRIVNEPELVTLLTRYGFKVCAPERLTFEEQVRLFHRAEVVISAHGSNWGNILFSGKIKILVLYPDHQPETHIFTMAKALGQEHFYLPGPERKVNSDFSVDLEAVEKTLVNEMALEPSAPGVEEQTALCR